MPPPVLLGLTVAVMYGCVCHAVVGRRLWQWPLFLVSAVAGFFAGYAAGVAFGIEWLRVGSLPMVASTVGAVVALWLCWFFSAPYAVPVAAGGPDPGAGQKAH